MTAVYDGEPIQAFFHSTSGGYTEAAVNVWGKDIPYLQAVKDDDKDSPNYSWTKSFTEAQLERTLKQGGYDIGKLQGIRLLPLGKAPMKWSSDRGTSGRVKRMTFKGSRRDVTLTGSQVRSLLGLNSTLFEVTIGTDEPDSIDVSIKNAYGYEVGRKKIPIDKKTRQGMGTKVGDLRLFAGVKDEKVFLSAAVGDTVWDSASGAPAVWPLKRVPVGKRIIIRPFSGTIIGAFPLKNVTEPYGHG